MTQSVLVTGGTRGIGFAIARGLATAGHAVTVLSRSRPAEPRLQHVPCDLTDAAQTNAALRAWLAAAGEGPDAFVHSACDYGATGRHAFADGTLAEWDAALAVNARGLYIALQTLLPAMLRRGHGTVVGISSDIATQPGPGRIPYAASKAAAHAILTGLAAELVGSGIAVVELAPRMQVDTPGIRRRRPPDFSGAGYADADVFVAPVRWLLDGAARDHHGACLWLAADGSVQTDHGS